LNMENWELEKVIISSMISFFGGGIVILVLFLFPEKVEKWIALLWKLISLFYKEGQKKYIAHDIQGKVNEFTNKKLSQEIKNYTPVGIEIEWIEEGQTPEEFFSDNKVIIRMRKSENQNKNLVAASMAFVSQSLLRKAKKYISDSQKESIDLFVVNKILKHEEPDIVDQFIQNFLFKMVDSRQKISEFFEKYNCIDKAGLFFPVFIQEMTFLGEKIFGGRKDQQIIIEVNKMIDFLESYSKREIGEDEIEKNFEGNYCRFALIIIAKAKKVGIGDTGPYTRYIEDLIRRGIENIYIVGPSKAENLNFIGRVSQQASLDHKLEKYNEKEYKAYIIKKGERIQVKTYLLVLRNPERQYYFDSEDQRKAIQ